MLFLKIAGNIKGLLRDEEKEEVDMTSIALAQIAGFLLISKEEERRSRRHEKNFGDQ